MQLLKGVSNYKGSNPALGKALVGGSALFGLMGIWSFYESYSTNKQIQYRKEQLKKPIVVLSEEQMINPPWNKNNLHEWLYRRVEVSGRPIHRSACLVPKTVSGENGYEYVIPLLVREDQDRSNQKGIILSKGFLPGRFKSPSTRYRIEDVSKQTFVGFVSRLQQLSSDSLLKGNAWWPGRLKYTSADIEDFSKSSQFVNADKASLAIVEKLHETGTLDERSYQRYSHDCGYRDVYPYSKTEAGALQLKRMPWDYKNDAKNYLLGSLVSLVIGASII